MSAQPSLRPPPHLLVVDDSAAQRALAAAVAADFGWLLDTADHGAAAVDACRTAGPFDLIMMDYRMPAMTGAEAARRIRALGGWAGDVPIVGATADWSLALERECLEAGMTICLAKPLPAGTLAALVDRFVSPRRRTLSRAAG